MTKVVSIESRESRAVKSYKDLLVWQKSMDLTVSVYKAVAGLPKEETYGLASQIKRSAVSIASHIAEGSSRRSTPEFLRFINIATGSLAELETQIITASRLTFLSETSVEPLLNQMDEISRMLQGLYAALEKKLP